MERKYDLVNVGIIVADLLIKLPCETLDFQSDMIRLPEIPLRPGGDAANSSITAAHLGLNVALCCKTGDDAVGRLVLSMVGDAGVDVSMAKTGSNLKTNVSAVMINSRGDRSLVCCSGNNRELSIEDIDLETLKQTRHVNISSLLAHPKLDRGEGETLFKMAKESGATTSADVTNDSYGTGFDGMKGILPYTDYFMPSYTEGKYLSGENEPERIADFFLRQGAGTIVIKLGGEGCLIKSKGRSIRCPAFNITPVDTTGAGDNFAAGFITGLLDGRELEACGRYANAVAAMSTLNLGATSPIDTGMVEIFMEKTPVKPF